MERCRRFYRNERLVGHRESGLLMETSVCAQDLYFSGGLFDDSLPDQRGLDDAWLWGISPQRHTPER